MNDPLVFWANPNAMFIFMMLHTEFKVVILEINGVAIAFPSVAWR